MSTSPAVRLDDLIGLDGERPGCTLPAASGFTGMATRSAPAP